MRWRPDPRTVTNAAAGVSAALAMSALLGLLRVTIGTSWLPELVGDRLVPMFPVGPFQQIVSWVGYNPLKVFGVSSGIVQLMLIGAIVGVVYSRWLREGRRATARLAVLLLGILVAFIAFFWPTLHTSYRGLPEAEARMANVVAHAAGFLLFGLILVPLNAPLDPRKTAGARSFSRRTVLIGTAAAAAAAALAGTIGRLFATGTFSYDGLRYMGRDVQALTPNDRFYVVTKNISDPAILADRWRLQVEGAVAQPMSFTRADIQASAASLQETTLMCVSNGVGDGLMSNAVWKGVPVATLLAPTRPRTGIVTAVFHAADAYSDTLPFATAVDPRTILAYEMNGEPIDERHGYPVRLIVPGLFGEKSVKWLTRIELVEHRVKGFYESQGWGPDFTVPTHSRIDVPESRAHLSRGADVTVRGVAFAGARGVSGVEISQDGGQRWNAARLEYVGSSLTWVLWTYAWRPDADGAYEIVVRATDGEGRPQISADRGIVPQGSTGYHRIHVTVG